MQNDLQIFWSKQWLASCVEWLPGGWWRQLDRRERELLRKHCRQIPETSEDKIRLNKVKTKNNFSLSLGTILILCRPFFPREGVGTSTIRTSTGQKFQNVEMVFLVDQNVKIRTSKMSFELIRTTTIRTSKIALKIKN